LVPAGGAGSVVVRANGANSNAVPFTMLTTLGAVTGVANRTKAGYAARATATYQRPPRDPAAPRTFEVQVAWYRNGSQLFAIERFTLGDLSGLREAAVNASVRTEAPPPYRVVVRARETLRDGTAYSAVFSCNSDTPVSGQPACSTADLPSPVGTVLSEATSEITIDSLP
ncbi:MAG: hypothetical protein ABL982_26245, partial [Vicinamibacterales bacterium]